MSGTSPLVLFIGSKGGVGTTTLCREIARLARERGNVALVDADLTGRRSIGVLLEVVRNLDSARVASPDLSVRTDGMTVVELAERYDAAFALDEGSVEQFTASMSGFDLIVVSAAAVCSRGSLVRRASGVLVVVEPTLLGVAGAQTLIGDLERFGIPSNRVSVVTNARSEADAIPRSEIEGALGNKLAAEIPPATNRNYAKSLSGLLKYIQTLPPAYRFTGLQPSTRSPLGDRQGLRRSHSLAGNGHAQAAKETTNPIDAQRDALKHQVHQALLRQVDLVTASTAHTDAAKLADLRAKVESITSDFISEHHLEVSAEDIAGLRQEIVDEALGLGPLEDSSGIRRHRNYGQRPG